MLVDITSVPSSRCHLASNHVFKCAFSRNDDHLQNTSVVCVQCVALTFYDSLYILTLFGLVFRQS